MSKRYFIFLYPNRGQIKSYLDLAIFLLNPQEKWPAHVTVAGPFDNKRKFRILRPFNTTVFALGAGNFFNHGSPTVFLRVGFQEREAIWRKPDFVGQPVPHLTLYDGKDMNFAQQVFAMAIRIRTYFSFQVNGLHIVESIPGQYRVDLREEVNVSLLEETKNLSLDQMAALDPLTRLQLSERALDKATSIL